MKIKFFILTIFMSTCLFADEGNFLIGGNFGNAGYTGSNLSGFAKNGFSFGGFMMYAPSELFELYLDANYTPHKKNNIKNNLIYTTIGLRTSMEYDLLKPFFIAGVGFYRASIDTGVVSDSSSSFGFNFGGGLDVKLTKNIFIGVMLRYHPVLAKEVATNVAGVDDIWDALFRVGFSFNTGGGTQSGWD